MALLRKDLASGRSNRDQMADEYFRRSKLCRNGQTKNQTKGLFHSTMYILLAKTWISTFYPAKVLS